MLCGMPRIAIIGGGSIGEALLAGAAKGAKDVAALGATDLAGGATDAAPGFPDLAGGARSVRAARSCFAISWSAAW